MQMRGNMPKTLDSSKMKTSGDAPKKENREPKKLPDIQVTPGSSYKSVAKQPKKLELNTMGSKK